MSNENVATKKLVFEIPADLHEKLKLYCIRNKTTITAEVTNLICGFLEAEIETMKEAETEAKTEIPLNKKEKTFDVDAFRKGLGLKPKEKVEQDFSSDSIFD
jgi:hypothetical protein